MKNATAFIAGILAGAATPTLVYANASYPMLKGSDLDRMRSDVLQINKDFSKIIDRENGKDKTGNEQ